MTLFEPPGPAAPSGPLIRVRMLVAYDGSGFHGFAEQPRVRTVGGTLRAALEKVLGHPVELACAGRTDKGVHAWGQVVSFDAVADRFEAERVARSVQKLCGTEIAIREVTPADEGFHARHSATSRTYRYTVLNRVAPDPFRARTSWHVPDPVDRALLELACDPFLGEQDFSAFCRRPKDDPDASLVRRVLDARWSEVEPGVLRLEISATAFCHQMVRSIVGAMVAAGRGRIRAGDIRGILTSRDRSQAPPIAPPEGLCLWHVGY